MTDHGSSVEVAALLKAREWSIRVLLLAAVGVLASVLYNIWSTVTFMRTFAVGRMGLGERATDFLRLGGNGADLLPLAMLLICGCFVLIHRPPQAAPGTTLRKTPTSRFAELQGELVGLAVLVGVVALGYVGVALFGLAVSQSLELEMTRAIFATSLASSAATLSLLGVLLTYWWILGFPRRVTHEIEIPVQTALEGELPVPAILARAAGATPPNIRGQGGRT